MFFWHFHLGPPAIAFEPSNFGIVRQRVCHGASTVYQPCQLLFSGLFTQFSTLKIGIIIQLVNQLHYHCWPTLTKRFSAFFTQCNHWQDLNLQTRDHLSDCSTNCITSRPTLPKVFMPFSPSASVDWIWIFKLGTIRLPTLLPLLLNFVKMFFWHFHLGPPAIGFEPSNLGLLGKGSATVLILFTNLANYFFLVFSPSASIDWIRTFKFEIIINYVIVIPTVLPLRPTLLSF